MTALDVLAIAMLFAPFAAAALLTIDQIHLDDQEADL